TALAHQAVDRGGGVVVVGALVDIVIEMTGTQYRTVVVLGGEDLAEQADPVVHRRIAVEVAGAVVVVQRFQVAAVRAAGPEGIGVVGSNLGINAQPVAEIQRGQGSGRRAVQRNRNGHREGCTPHCKARKRDILVIHCLLLMLLFAKWFASFKYQNGDSEPHTSYRV